MLASIPSLVIWVETMVLETSLEAWRYRHSPFLLKTLYHACNLQHLCFHETAGISVPFTFSAAVNSTFQECRRTLVRNFVLARC